MKPRQAALLVTVYVFAIAGTLAAGQAAPKPKKKAKDREPIHVWADRIRYLNREGKALIQGHATVIKGDFRIDCDRIEATLEPKTNRITRIVATGNVRVCTVKPIAERTNPRPKIELLPNARRAMCARGEYDPATEIVVLKGSVGKQPIVYVGKDCVQADLVTYDRKKDMLLFDGRVKLSALLPKRGDTLNPLAPPAPKQ